VYSLCSSGVSQFFHKLEVSKTVKDLGYTKDHIPVHKGFNSYLGLPVQTASGVVNTFLSLSTIFRRSKEEESSTKFDVIVGHIKKLYDIPTYEDYDLYVTGHSLGGALAQLMAMKLAASDSLKNYPQAFPITAITFASPQVGGGYYQQAFSLLEKAGRLRHIRFSNQGDMVPVLPPASMGYTQTGVTIHVQDGLKAEIGYRNPLKSVWSQMRWNNPLKRHTLTEYHGRMMLNDPELKTKNVENLYQDYLESEEISTPITAEL
jgi:hypothetical protein